MKKIESLIHMTSIPTLQKELRSELGRMNIPKREITHTELFLEEFVNLIEPYYSGQKMFLRVEKKMGDVKIRIAFEGDSRNILELFEEHLENNEDEKYYRAMLLRSYLHQVSYLRKNGQNIVIIAVKKNENKQIFLTLSAMLAGMLVGLLLKYLLPDQVIAGIDVNIFSLIKSMFLNALKMMVAPIVFFSLVSCISGMTNLSELGRIGGKVFGLYMCTTIIAIALGFGIGSVVFFGDLGTIPTTTSYEAVEAAGFSITDTIKGIIPSNLVSPILNGEMLQIIFVAILVGIAVGMIGEQGKVLTDLFHAGNQLSLKIISLIIKFVPIASFCSMASLMISSGIGTLLSLLRLLAGILLGVVLMMMVYALIILIVGKQNPLPFLKKNAGFMITPFSLVSSSASMPLTMKFCTEKLGIDPKISSFSIPIGATMNMDGTCVFLVLASMMFAKLYGIPIDQNFMFTVAVSTFVLSIGAPGVQGSGIICLSMMVISLGIPVECIGIIMGVDQILGMIRTASNVSGDIAVTVATASTEKALDLSLYKSVSH